MLVVAAGCGGGTEQVQCEAESCSGHGDCDDSGDVLTCVCNPGYSGDRCDSCAGGFHDDGTGTCVADETCQPDSCSGHGQCDDGAGVVCTCDEGYKGVACESCTFGYKPDGSGNCIVDNVRIVGGVVVHEITPNGGGDNPTTRISTDQIYDRTFPGHVFGVINWKMFEVTLEAGDCVYFTEIEDCPTPCGADHWCTPADVCEPVPVYRHAGVLTLEGLSVPVSLSPEADGRYGMTYLPPDVFQQGDTITLNAAGGETPAFTLSTTGVEDVEPAFPCDLGLQDGQDLVITWTPSSGPGFIRFEMFTHRHSGHGPMVLCEVEDTGSLTVPAVIIDQYLLDQTPEDSYALSRVNQETVEVDNGNSVGLAVMASRICWNAP
jgi:hypothetical protein